MLARAGSLALPDYRRCIFDHPIVMESALRHIARLPAADGAPLAPLLERWLHFPVARVAWLAAIALLRWGRREPYDDVRSGGRLGTTLGASALDVFVLAGSAEDLPHIERVAAKLVPSAALLSALARFGHAGACAYLVHYLEDEDLVDDAAEALETL